MGLFGCDAGLWFGMILILLRLFCVGCWLFGVVIKVCLLAGIGGFAFACGFLVLVVRLVF